MPVRARLPLPACLCPPARLPACLLVSLPACPPANLPARPPTCPPPTCLPARPPACPSLIAVDVYVSFPPPSLPCPRSKRCPERPRPGPVNSGRSRRRSRLSGATSLPRSRQGSTQRRRGRSGRRTLWSRVRKQTGCRCGALTRLVRCCAADSCGSAAASMLVLPGCPYRALLHVTPPPHPLCPLFPWVCCRGASRLG